MTTKVSKLANDAKLMAKVNVCASLPYGARCWSSGLFGASLSLAAEFLAEARAADTEHAWAGA